MEAVHLCPELHYVALSGPKVGTRNKVVYRGRWGAAVAETQPERRVRPWQNAVQNDRYLPATVDP